MDSLIDAIRCAREAEDGAPAAPAPFVWAIGGGKGGVGKSVIASSLALSLARAGERAVLVDADLGGANLHTVLGVRHPRWTLAHFLNNEVSGLSELMCPGPVQNLWLISGAQALLEMANPAYSRKAKLLRHIRRLEVDHVILDLGAGSAFNVLDFFVAAERGILVVVPEPTSIENAYHFLKAAFFRGLRDAARRSAVRETIYRLLEERGRRRVRSPRDLLDAVGRADSDAGALLRRRAEAFRPLLIVNQVRTVEDRRVGEDIARACREYLGTELEYAGALERDECVRVAVRERRPVLERFPGCPFSRDLGELVERLRREKRLARRDGADDAPASAPPPGPARRSESLAIHGLDVQGRAAEGPGDESPARCVRRAARELRGTPRLPGPRAAGAPLPPLDLSRPGEYLRRCREHLELGIRELARRTRILCLADIEAERFGRLPPEPYIRGFVLNYARALGIENPGAVAASFVERYREAAAG